MSGAILLVAVGILFLLVRILHFASQGMPPTLFFKESSFNKSILSKCSLLFDTYIPPLLWGKSGHLQTIIYGKMGRINSPFPKGERKLIVMQDGSTMSYDVFEPENQHKSNGDYTLLMCPGLANSSESLYICTCVHYAQSHGYRVAVLNHLGVPKNVPLTGDRIFNYGNTEEYGLMVDAVIAQYPDTKCIAVGFSMGGNIIVRWLGQSEENQKKVIAAMSCCQGYSALDARKLQIQFKRAANFLLSWEHLRRIYLYCMTLNQLNLLRRHKNLLLGPEANAKYGPFDEKAIFSSTSLIGIDRNYTAKRFGFKNEEDYYDETSCKHIIDKIRVPMFLLNAMDDPIVPPELHITPRQTALKHDNIIFATTQHGGHLGYFEGGLFFPDTITWLDRIVVQYCDAVIEVTGGKSILSKHEDEGEISDELTKLSNGTSQPNGRHFMENGSAENNVKQRAITLDKNNAQSM